MAFELQTLYPKNLTKEIIKTLKSLTINKESGMNKILFQISKKKEKYKGKIILLKDDSKIIGWALISHEPAPSIIFGTGGMFSFAQAKTSSLIQLYISSEYRGLGLGKKLFQRAARNVRKKKIAVVAWSEDSKKFFSSLNKKRIVYV